MGSAPVIPQAPWPLLSWLQKTTEGCAWCMTTAARPVNRPEPYSTRTAGPPVTTATEAYGETRGAGPLKRWLLSVWPLCCRLNLNNSVGRCLEQDGTKVRQWNWSGIGRVPTAQDPLHLSLNERITVQILGREQVFLAFQACGEEVKLSVGRCFS